MTVVDPGLEIVGDATFFEFLEKELSPSSVGHSTSSREEEGELPNLAPYLSDPDRESPPFENNPIKLTCSQPRARSMFDGTLNALSSTLAEHIGLVLALGGAKALAGVLKAWIESRSKTGLKFRRGNEVIEIRGRVPPDTLAKLTEILAASAPKVRSLAPKSERK